MDTREQGGTFDLFAWGISQQPVSESFLYACLPANTYNNLQQAQPSRASAQTFKKKF